MRRYLIIIILVFLIIATALYSSFNERLFNSLSQNKEKNEANDSIKYLGNPYITNYQFNLSNQQVWSICHNEQGEMVFANRQGITVFNGSVYKNISLSSSPLCLKFVERDNLIFVGCEKDLGYLKREKTGEYKYTSLKNDKFKPSEIIDIQITDRYIYFYSNESVFRFQKGTLKLDKLWIAKEEENFNGIVKFKNEVYLSKKNTGFINIESIENKEIVQNSKAISFHQIVFSLPISDNKILIGTENNKLFLFNGQRIVDYIFKDQKYLDENQLVGGINLSEKYYALSTISGGILIIDKNNALVETKVNYQNGLPDNEIYAMGIDIQGGLWLSHGFGISRLNYKLPVHDYGQYPGIDGNLLDIIEYENTLYIATTQGVYYLDTLKDEKELKTFSKKQIEEKKSEESNIPVQIIKEETIKDEAIKEEQNEPEKKKNIFQKWRENRENRRKKKAEAKADKNEQVTENNLDEAENIVNPVPIEEKKEIDKKDIKSEKKKKKEKQVTPSYAFKRIKDIKGKCKQLVKSKNGLLISSNNGLYCIEKGKSTVIFKKGYINTIQPSINPDVFYIGTDKGITAIKWENKKWKEFKKINPKNFNEEVLSIVEDEERNLWVGTGSLIYHFILGKELNTKSYLNFNIENQYQNNISIRKIHNQVYFLLSRQFYKYNKSNGKIEADNQVLPDMPMFFRYIFSQTEIAWFQDEKNWKYLSDKYQLSKYQVSLLNLFENIQNIRLDDTHNLWVINGKNEIYKIEPAQKAGTYLSDFKVYLEKIQADNGKLVPIDNISIPQDVKSISLKIGAPYYLRSAGVEYQYYIKGKMNDWSEWKSNSTFDFIVNPGRFLIKLRAKNIFGDICESDFYMMNVSYPIWMKAWFIVTISVIGILFIFLIVIWIMKKRQRRLQRDNKNLEEKINERTTEIIKQKEQIEHKNKEITDSLNYASQIQAAVLPSLQILKDHTDEFFIINKPKDIVSGDFYWTAYIHDKLIITAADCTGHGVPGAFLSLLGVTFLNEITGKIAVEDMSANLILDSLRARIINSLHQQGLDKKRFDGIDLSLVVIDPEVMELQFAGANNPIYILRNGHLTEFKGNRMPIGVQSLKVEPFTNHIIDIKKGDKVYLFSDGYIDQFGGEAGRKFLSRNFKALLEEIFELPLKEQKKLLLEAFSLWKNKYEQIDDVLIIGIKI